MVRVEATRQAITVELPGRTRASQIAEIRPQVSGIVQRRLFEEGALVRAGQVLYDIDPASFEAAVASAQAQVIKAQAVLTAARLTAKRQSGLLKVDAVSQQEAEDSQATLQQAEGDLAIAQANLVSQRINLARTRITAPISGRIDISSVTAGALVTAGQAQALTTVQQLDPLLVDVAQPSGELLKLRRELANGTLKQNPSGSAPVQILLEDGSLHPQPGQLQFKGMTVDQGTGAVTLRAQVPNPDGALLPGMYVRARLETGVIEQALLVPQKGVTRSPTGQASALVVGPDGQVARRALTIERAVGNRWLVSEGLKPGDQVIVEGLQRAKAGATVRATPVNAAASQGAVR